MEYIQTVLVQVEASRLERASEPGGLLAELDEHRSFLRQQLGFRDIRITRSINPEGNVLLVIETRWDDDESLVRYETTEPNVASVINNHRDVIVAGTLQVLDMEALRTDTRADPHAAYRRTALPLLIPVGVLAFVLLFIYGLSRVYLEIKGDGAVALAAGLSIAVLLVAAYFANNPRAPGWQIGGVIGLAALTLLGGTIWAVSEKDEGEATGAPSAQASPAPGGQPSGGAAGAANEIDMADFVFKYQGADNPTISVPAGQATTFDIKNSGKALHNMHVASGGKFDTDICGPGDNNPCSDPNQIRAGQSAKITINIAQPGTYDFRCDFHPTQMTGKIEVK
jgi:plastocyanin